MTTDVAGQVQTSNSPAKQSFSQKADVFLNKRVVPGLKIVASNRYLRSLMEGFYVTLPIIVFSSIIGIIMWVPPAIKGDMEWYPLAARQALNRIYALTMGLISIWFAMGIATSLAEKLNSQLISGRKMNIMMVAFAAGSAIFMMSVTGTFALKDNGQQTENFANLLIGNLAAQGMLTAILVGLTLPWVFYLPVRFNWTIRLPKAVPQGVSQSFADIIPYGLSVLVYWAFGYIFIGTLGVSFTDALFKAIEPVFSGLDSYGFLAVTAFLTAAIWFIGVHGPSVTRPFLTPFMFSNLANNQELLARGAHPHWALTYEFAYDFSASLGGTGATFVIPFLFIVFCKSKQAKAVGIASYIPIWFQVNEPALFGAPMILNPIFALPFLVLPVLNVVIYKFFISVVGMNAAIADVPWSIPAIVGLLIGSAFDPWTILLWFVMVTLDFFVYLPFVLVYDRMMCNQEIQKSKEENLSPPLHYSYFTLLKLRIQKLVMVDKTKRTVAAETLTTMKTEIKTDRQTAKAERLETRRLEKEKIKELNEIRKRKQILETNSLNQEKVATNKNNLNILILCYGAGTSAMLAASIERGVMQYNLDNFHVDSAAYGTHQDKIKDTNLVILSPQVKMYIDDIRLSAPHAQYIVTNGKQYADATKDKNLAYQLLKDNLPAEYFAVPEKNNL